MSVVALTVSAIHRRFVTVHAVAGGSFTVVAGEIFALGVLTRGKEPSCAEVSRWAREVQQAGQGVIEPRR